MAGTTFFYLYRVTVEPHGGDESYSSFEEILRDPKDEYTMLESSGNSFQLDGTVRKTQGIYYGAFCLLQTSELPTKVSWGQDPVDLLDGEDDQTGLGHYTSFFYDSTYEMIGIQSNRNGISASGIEYFFQRNYFVRVLKFELVIDPAELARLNNLTEINSIEISIAKPQDATVFSNNTDTKSFQTITKIADETNANVFRIFLGVGYNRNDSLDRGRVLRYIRSVFGKRETYNVAKIEIKGYEGDEEKQKMIDLVNNKVKLIVTLPRTRSANRTYTQNLITRAITEYNNIKPNLTTYKIKSKHG